MDWSYWLGRKYAAISQQADADTTRANAGLISANAGANLDTVRAGLLPKQTAAEIANQNAQTAGILETNKFIGPLATSQIGLQSSGARQNIAQAGLLGSETEGNNLFNTRRRGFLGFLDQIRQSPNPYGSLGL